MYIGAADLDGAAERSAVPLEPDMVVLLRTGSFERWYGTDAYTTAYPGLDDSGWAVDRKIRAAVKEHPGSILARAAQGMERGEARALAPAIAEGCTVAQQILTSTAEDFAFGLSHVTHLMHPEVIVLGGGLVFVGEPLRAAVESALRRFVMEAFAPGPRVLLSALREDAVPVGALLLAAQHPAAPVPSR